MTDDERKILEARRRIRAAIRWQPPRATSRVRGSDVLALAAVIRTPNAGSEAATLAARTAKQWSPHAAESWLHLRNEDLAGLLQALTDEDET